MASDITCAGCGFTRERPVTRAGGRRTPAGWKSLQARFWCPACKRERFVLRAIALPVSGPVDGTWAELRVALHTTFAETTRCANWLVTEFYARDRQREPGDSRLPPMPHVYLYPEARLRFPALASQSLASLEQQVLARYRAARLALVWRHAVSLPTYRYPTPLPLPARMWTLEQQQQRWRLSVRIGDRRWLLQLRHGPGLGRQVRVLRDVAAGTVEAGEATLYEIPAHGGDHRSESAPARRLMLKIAVWLPRRPRAVVAPAVMGAGERAGGPAVIVRTASHAFVTAQLAHGVAGSRKALTLRGEQVRRWIAEAARRPGVWSGDPGDVVAAAGIDRRRAARLRRRLHSWTHQATAHLVGWAERRGVTTIVWDDTVQGYLPAYPWRRFVITLTDKARLAGMDVVLGRDMTSDGENAIDGPLQAEASARPGTLAGRDRAWERAQAPEIAGRVSRRLRDDRSERRTALSIAGERSSGFEAEASAGRSK